ncbi:Uncharacterized protein ALO57_00141 [Pseudomonas coronafaciens pv. oryzae]|uniref:hypothetical protein n=1 Tax=Pseudomonas coronafaciens TaxID=53409 RepID=UPI0006B43EEB|nr:hypothetical protein [Pseudomonas coronafaciens]KPB51359.1 Uncharacterized protein AC511_1517 [Pseudomonas coronafaciens pv. oryzae]KPY06360.1 Uncharacterized protein ALO57_00141 [Pseudomonas coronafaciens pv. oryzae]
MSHQFKPGDLALLLIDVGPLACGSAVELIKRIGAGTEVELVGGGKAECLEGSWVFSHSMIPGPGLAFAPERLLMPLQGDPSPEQQKAKEAVPCM